MYTFQLPWHQYKSSLTLEGKGTWRREEQKENLRQMTARKLKACLSSKCISWTKAGNDNKKGCRQKFHVSTYHFNSFFQINCLTSFEISWVTTNMSINENVTKEKNIPTLQFSRGSWTLPTYSYSEKKGLSVHVLIFQKNHSDMFTHCIAF